jgi:hypothetical protein
MAIFVATGNPTGLLQQIRSAIDSGAVETWKYDKDGDFTHSPPQWKNKAWLRPSLSPGLLRLGILGQENTTLSKEVYAVYHGRFIEMLLAHFDDSFSRAEATAKLLPPDVYKPTV